MNEKDMKDRYIDPMAQPDISELEARELISTILKEDPIDTFFRNLDEGMYENDAPTEKQLQQIEDLRNPNQ